MLFVFLLFKILSFVIRINHHAQISKYNNITIVTSITCDYKKTFNLKIKSSIIKVLTHGRNYILK